MPELIIIIGIALIATILLWFLAWRTKLSWDTPYRPITPTPEKETSADLTRCDRIIRYLNEVETQVEQSQRSDKAEIREMLFKLKNRWKIIYSDTRPKAIGAMPSLPPHPKVLSAAADRDNLEVKLMDKGIDLEYPD